MKYKFIYLISALFLISLWGYHFVHKNLAATTQMETEVDSTMVIPPMAVKSDTMNFPTAALKEKAVHKVSAQPQIIYVKSDDDSILGVSNNLLTLLITIANIVLLVVEVKKKRSAEKLV